MENILAVGCLVLAVTAGGSEVVVSPDGLSPAQALEKIRAAKARGDKSAWTVRVKPGHYALKRTLVFTPADSGTPEAPVTWIGEGDAVLAGGEILKGWKDEGGAACGPRPCRVRRTAGFTSTTALTMSSATTSSRGTR